MELALLCQVKVGLCIVDKNEKTTIYSSESNVGNFISKYLVNYKSAKELLTHDDVKKLINVFSIQIYLLIIPDFQS